MPSGLPAHLDDDHSLQLSESIPVVIGDELRRRQLLTNCKANALVAICCDVGKTP